MEITLKFLFNRQEGVCSCGCVESGAGEKEQDKFKWYLLRLKQRKFKMYKTVCCENNFCGLLML